MIEIDNRLGRVRGRRSECDCRREDIVSERILAANLFVKGKEVRELYRSKNRTIKSDPMRCELKHSNEYIEAEMKITCCNSLDTEREDRGT